MERRDAEASESFESTKSGGGSTTSKGFRKVSEFVTARDRIQAGMPVLLPEVAAERRPSCPERVVTANLNMKKDRSQNQLYEVSSDMFRIPGYTYRQYRRLLRRRATLDTECKGRDVFTDKSTSIDNVDKMPDFFSRLPKIKVVGTTRPSDEDRIARKRPSMYYRYRGPSFGSGSEGSTAHRLRVRKQLFAERQKLCDFSLLFASIGIGLAIIESELTATYLKKADLLSTFLRWSILLSTVVLLLLIFWYHAKEIKIALIDSGAEDWRVAVSFQRILCLLIELAICSICPLPASGYFYWPYLNRDQSTVRMVRVPVDVLLSVPMFLRAYLFGRFMVLHSTQFQDAATRSIAALNRISVNFAFVLRTRMLENPLQSLIVFSGVYWLCVGWMVTQCERHGSLDNYYWKNGSYYTKYEQGSVKIVPQHTYLNCIWLIMVTFMSIGYGDIVPNTYCGRALSVITGVVGAAASSALIAVIARKLELTKAEKHVNNFMSDSKLSQMRKNAAAWVLQETWFIHKYRMTASKDDTKVRVHQRRFLRAINEFRKVKWDQRKLAEKGNALVDIGQVQLDLHEVVHDMQKTQNHLISQIVYLTENIMALQNMLIRTSGTVLGEDNNNVIPPVASRKQSETIMSFNGFQQEHSDSTDLFL